MSYTLRTKDGTMVAKFEGLAAKNIMDATEGAGHWRQYKTDKMKHPIDVYQIDANLVVGEERNTGKLSIYLWEGSILIPE